MNLTCHVCKTEDCFRYCTTCCRYLCNEHLCLHLESSVLSFAETSEDNDSKAGKNWLNNELILQTMSTKALKDTKLRYETLVLLINKELRSRERGEIEYVQKSKNLVAKQNGRTTFRFDSTVTSSIDRTNYRRNLSKLLKLGLSPVQLLKILEESK